MHELSIAQSVITIVQQSVPENELHAVSSVKMKVGALAGVVPDSLEFCFSALTSGTPLSGAALQIESVPFVIQCNTCQRSFPTEHGFVLCPRCEGTDTTVLTGTELQVVEIELADGQGEAP